MDINNVAEGLYSLPPEEFTAARNVRETEAKALGDQQLAAAIHQLRRPSTGAWLANQLVRAHPAEVNSFLVLGAALREATATLSGDQLRELGKQRRQLVHALIEQVRGLADAAGHKVSQESARGLEDTLHAALADERVADQLRAGRLTETLQGAGFPPTAGDRSPEPTTSPDSAKNESSEERPDLLGGVEREEELARVAVRGAADDQDRARAVLERTETALLKVRALVNGLRADLDRAEMERSRREQEYRQAQADLDGAGRAGREASRRLEDAIQGRERLSK